MAPGIRAELAVAVLEQHGPAITEALWQLDEAATSVWKALSLVEPTEDKWRMPRAACDRHRPWLACRIWAGVDA